MTDNEDPVVNKIILILIGIIALLLLSIILMIPVANVFIAHAVFGGD